MSKNKVKIVETGKLNNILSEGYRGIRCSNADCCHTAEIFSSVPAVIEDNKKALELMVGLCSKCYKALKKTFGKETK